MPCPHCGSATSFHPVSISFCALYEYLSGARMFGSIATACVRDGNADGAWGAAVSAAHYANLWDAEIERLRADVPVVVVRR